MNPPRWRLPLALGVAAAILQTGVGLLGGSVAVPALGPAAPGVRGLTPPWDLDAGLSPWATTVVLLLAAGLGAACLVTGWRAWRAGARVDLRVVATLGGLALVAMVAVPAQGSADHLSYAAYGRIAAIGDDPYIVDPLTWRGGDDPVTSSVQPPWQHTRSVYGPVATAAQAFAGWWGDGNLRATVGAWQLLCALAFAGAALALHAWAGRSGTDSGGDLADGPHSPPATPRDPHARVAVLWTLNPLLLGQLVLGAHIDVLAVAAALAGLTLIARRPLTAGVLLGAAVGIKAPYAMAALAALVGLASLGRRGRSPGLRAGLGALVVLVPAHLWTGVHTYDQLWTASRFISLAAPWRIIADVTDPIFGASDVRSVLPRVASLCALGLAFLLWRARVGMPDGAPPPGAPEVPDDVRAGRLALRTHLLLASAWVLTAPYVLPWYDAMLWAPLAVICWSPVVDAALWGRLVVLVLAYIPGLNVGVPERLEDVTIGFRHWVAPWLTLTALVVIVRWAWREAARAGTAARPGRGSAGVGSASAGGQAREA